jgi:hypothetical protein
VLPSDHEDSYQIHQLGGCIVDSGNNTSQSKASIGQNISDINVSIIETGVSPDTSQFSLFQLRRPELCKVMDFLITVDVIMKGSGRHLFTSIAD